MSCLAVRTIRGLVLIKGRTPLVVLSDSLMSTIPFRSALFDTKAVSQCHHCAVWLSHRCLKVLYSLLPSQTCRGSLSHSAPRLTLYIFCNTALEFTYELAHFNVIIGWHARSNQGHLLFNLSL